MKRYQYRVIGETNLEEFEAAIAGAGEEGWEISHFSTCTSGDTVYLAAIIRQEIVAESQAPQG